MNKAILYYFIGVALFLLLGINIASVFAAPLGDLHGVSGLLLAWVCLVHFALHLLWSQAARHGGKRGKIYPLVNAMTMLALLWVVASGLVAQVRPAFRGTHAVTGAIVLLSLLIHAVRHLRWITAVSAWLLREIGEHAPQNKESLESSKRNDWI